MFDLRSHIASKPIMDAPFLRQLETADAFNAVHEARGRLSQIEREYDEAQRFLKARIAEAAILEYLEGLRND